MIILEIQALIMIIIKWPKLLKCGKIEGYVYFDNPRYKILKEYYIRKFNFKVDKNYKSEYNIKIYKNLNGV
jgi:hypothetical protein